MLIHLRSKVTFPFPHPLRISSHKHISTLTLSLRIVGTNCNGLRLRVSHDCLLLEATTSRQIRIWAAERKEKRVLTPQVPTTSRPKGSSHAPAVTACQSCLPTTTLLCAGRDRGPAARSSCTSFVKFGARIQSLLRACHCRLLAYLVAIAKSARFFSLVVPAGSQYGSTIRRYVFRI